MPYAPTAVLAGRHSRLRRTLIDRQLDGLIITYLPNVFYMTNFPGSAAIVLLTTDHLYFITDFRYVTAVEDAWASPSGCPNAELVRVETTYDDALVALLKRTGIRRVAFEAARVPFAQHGRWVTALGGQASEQAESASPVLVPGERLVEMARVRKDEHEVATLTSAASLLTAIFDRIVAEVRPGRDERQVAARIEWVMKDAGFERAAFDTIVASGPNGALPHAHPGSRVLTTGDLVVLDFGGVYDGYCVDLTRTVSLGPPNHEARRVYDAVVQAHAAGMAASRAGATVREVDRAARGTLEGLGFGEAFGHGTGHGLGIEVHEEPWVARTRADEPSRRADGQPDVVLEEGMVFTIEPGVYLPGWGGVRLEDDVVMTTGGQAAFLTHVPRELAAI